MFIGLYFNVSALLMWTNGMMDVLTTEPGNVCVVGWGGGSVWQARGNIITNEKLRYWLIVFVAGQVAERRLG